MSVASKLRGAFALYIALLAAVLVYHVRTIQRAVESGHTLTAISSRFRAISDDQLGRVGEMSRTAEKYLVTRDRGYLDKFLELAGAYGKELRRLESLALSAEERSRLRPLADHWRVVDLEAKRLGGASAAEVQIPRFARDDTGANAADALAGLEPTLDQISLETEQLGQASQGAMSRELAASEQAARDAEQISWVAAVVALLLSVLLSALLVRSIVRPLDRLAKGARAISAGRLGFRLDAKWGARDELTQVALEFNAMAERLEALDRMKREFVSNVSHDLKTPLSSMQETNEVLLDEVPGALSEKQRQLLQLSQESGRRLSAMIAKLLDLSRLEAAPWPAFELLDLVSLVRRTVDRAHNDRRRADGKRDGDPSVTLIEPARPLFVRGDGEGITQILDNLLENAIKFSPPNGTIRVILEQSDGVVQISVADEGPGVPDADKERVFERFCQTATGRAVRGEARGVGLGLAICRQIAALHGGTVHVSDNVPRGAVFTVRLPSVARVPAEALVTVESAA